MKLKKDQQLWRKEQWTVGSGILLWNQLLPLLGEEEAKPERCPIKTI
ncbi:hypothetical protein [Sphingobacterium paucimobilis]|uniref:Uncharacterized protein n=1 Tax=Sphingobacterium paucimobilis HER1398 TaxID=1346330 RepID=U2HVM8_9SPHI|nr:hypothetical protein [Sphingobacterium paucimobilis]ERJ59330.1 hypothetical protein M472_11150 [Sphingobacterium paucimobilis HER1398]